MEEESSAWGCSGNRDAEIGRPSLTRNGLEFTLRMHKALKRQTEPGALIFNYIGEINK